MYPCRSLVSKENTRINPVANPKHFLLECRKKIFLTTVNPKIPPTDNQFHSSDCRQPTTHRYCNDEMITSDVCRGGPLHPRAAWSDITRWLVVLPPARLKHLLPDLTSMAMCLRFSARSGRWSCQVTECSIHHLSYRFVP